jgi:membrane dipeptidase
MSPEASSRRRFIKLSSALAFPMIARGRFRFFEGTATEYSARTIDLMQRTTVADMLSPLTLNSQLLAKWFSDPRSFTDAEYQRYKDSGISVFHIAEGIGGPNAYEEVLKFVAGWDGFIAGNGDRFVRIGAADDLARVKRSGKIGILIGVQNSEHFRRADDVDLFHGLGQRVSQLTYNARNMIGNGSTERRDDGISDFGVAIIERMNKVGMAVDVSHCGDRTSLDAFQLSKSPVLVTHSNCRSLASGHPRTKTDEAIKAVGKAGSIMGITGVRMFVKATDPTTIEDVLDHFDHVRDLIGPEHLAVGSDIDLNGYDALPAEQNQRLRNSYKGSYGFREKIDIDRLNHPKRMFDLTEGLIRRGYTDDQIAGILGGNAHRVLDRIWSLRS